MYKNFDDLISKYLESKPVPKKAVVAGAGEEHVLEAVFTASEKGFCYPVLVGDETIVKEKIESLGYTDKEYDLYHCDIDKNPSEVAVKLIHEKKGDFIVKGKLETKDLLKPILNKETGLNSKGFITHFGLMQIEGYHKLLGISDCAVILNPDLETKAKILNVGLEFFRKLGYEKPIAGALCAVEVVNEKMEETVHAKALEEMSQKGEFGECAVVGPISYDLATRKESAEIKGYDSPYAGDVDFILAPNMLTGNVMSKLYTANPNNRLAGCLAGADVPIVLTSRSASTDEKLLSILLCNMLS